LVFFISFSWFILFLIYSLIIFFHAVLYYIWSSLFWLLIVLFF
jgi:hypothetical protein